MKFKRLHIEGNKYGMLTVIRVYDQVCSSGIYRYLCKCECGKKTIVRGTMLRKGQTKSCGCMSAMWAAQKNRKHGKTDTPIYNIWRSMLKRCNNKNNKDFKNYGGRGIGVSVSWHVFGNFYKDMGDKPKGKTLGRIDNNGNYTKNNCRWETPTEQARNRRTSKKIKYKGKTKTLVEWGEEYNISPKLIRARLQRKYTMTKALCNKDYRKKEKK